MKFWLCLSNKGNASNKSCKSGHTVKETGSTGGKLFVCKEAASDSCDTVSSSTKGCPSTTTTAPIAHFNNKESCCHLFEKTGEGECKTRKSSMIDWSLDRWRSECTLKRKNKANNCDRHSLKDETLESSKTPVTTQAVKKEKGSYNCESASSPVASAGARCAPSTQLDNNDGSTLSRSIKKTHSPMCIHRSRSVHELSSSKVTCHHNEKYRYRVERCLSHNLHKLPRYAIDNHDGREINLPPEKRRHSSSKLVTSQVNSCKSNIHRQLSDACDSISYSTKQEVKTVDHMCMNGAVSKIDATTSHCEEQTSHDKQATFTDDHSRVSRGLLSLDSQEMTSGAFTQSIASSSDHRGHFKSRIEDHSAGPRHKNAVLSKSQVSPESIVSSPADATVTCTVDKSEGRRGASLNDDDVDDDCASDMGNRDQSEMRGRSIDGSGLVSLVNHKARESLEHHTQQLYVSERRFITASKSQAKHITSVSLANECNNISKEPLLHASVSIRIQQAPPPSPHDKCTGECTFPPIEHQSRGSQFPQTAFSSSHHDQRAMDDQCHKRKVQSHFNSSVSSPSNKHTPVDHVQACEFPCACNSRTCRSSVSACHSSTSSSTASHVTSVNADSSDHCVHRAAKGGHARVKKRKAPSVPPASASITCVQIHGDTLHSNLSPIDPSIGEQSMSNTRSDVNLIHQSTSQQLHQMEEERLQAEAIDSFTSEIIDLEHRSSSQLNNVTGPLDDTDLSYEEDASSSGFSSRLSSSRNSSSLTSSHSLPSLIHNKASNQCKEKSKKEETSHKRLNISSSRHHSNGALSSVTDDDSVTSTTRVHSKSLRNEFNSDNVSREAQNASTSTLSTCGKVSRKKKAPPAPPASGTSDSSKGAKLDGSEVSSSSHEMSKNNGKKRKAPKPPTHEAVNEGKLRERSKGDEKLECSHEDDTSVSRIECSPVGQVSEAKQTSASSEVKVSADASAKTVIQIAQKVFTDDSADCEKESDVWLDCSSTTKWREGRKKEHVVSRGTIEGNESVVEREEGEEECTKWSANAVDEAIKVTNGIGCISTVGELNEKNLRFDEAKRVNDKKLPLSEGECVSNTENGRQSVSPNEEPLPLGGVYKVNALPGEEEQLQSSLLQEQKDRKTSLPSKKQSLDRQESQLTRSMMRGSELVSSTITPQASFQSTANSLAQSSLEAKDKIVSSNTSSRDAMKTASCSSKLPQSTISSTEGSSECRPRKARVLPNFSISSYEDSRSHSSSITSWGGMKRANFRQRSIASNNNCSPAESTYRDSSFNDSVFLDSSKTSPSPVAASVTVPSIDSSSDISLDPSFEFSVDEESGCSLNQCSLSSVNSSNKQVSISSQNEASNGECKVMKEQSPLKSTLIINCPSEKVKKLTAQLNSSAPVTDSANVTSGHTKRLSLSDVSSLNGGKSLPLKINRALSSNCYQTSRVDQFNRDEKIIDRSIFVENRNRIERALKVKTPSGGSNGNNAIRRHVSLLQVNSDQAEQSTIASKCKRLSFLDFSQQSELNFTRVDKKSVAEEPHETYKRLDSSLISDEVYASDTQFTPPPPPPPPPPPGFFAKIVALSKETINHPSQPKVSTSRVIKIPHNNLHDALLQEIRKKITVVE